MTITEAFDMLSTGGRFMWIKPKISRQAGRVLAVDKLVEGVGVYTIVPGMGYKPFFYTFEYEVVDQPEAPQDEPEA